MALSKKWQLSAFDYHVDAFIVPCLAGAGLLLAPIVGWQIILGIFMWSLTEYCLHRFLFHKYFRRDHWAHHVNPQAYIGISGLYIGIISALMLGPAFMLGLTSLYSGYMLGYLAYLILHFSMHRKHSRMYRLIIKLVRNHELHHQKGVEKNFGVTSPLWDFVFRTYVSRKRAASSTNGDFGRQ